MIDPLINTPSEITDTLIAWAGLNEYGEPYWRIILAENHLVQRAGTWTEMDPGTEMATPTGTDFKLAVKQIAPEAIRTGVRWVPFYPITGWILERWYPPESFGSREQWLSALSQDGETPMMGPYPERGGYFMPSGGGPWPEIPPLESLRASISQWENGAHSHGQIDEEGCLKAMRQAQEEADAREQENYERFLKDIAYFRTHNLEFIKSNPSLSGYRNKLAANAGHFSHV